jgi:glycosyltransferase involved in cell wall biosynthesis
MKILIVNTHLRVGGIKAALLNLFSNIDLNTYQVDLLLLTNDDNVKESCSKIPGVNLLEELFFLNIYFTAFREYLQRRDILRIFIKILIYFLSKLIGARGTLLLLLKFEKKLKGYDVAISFANDIWVNGFGGGSNDFVIHNVQAKRKFAWVHNDPYRLGFTKEICQKTYMYFDKIVCVSEACKLKLLEIIPEYDEKLGVVYNMFNIDEIKRKSVESVTDDFEGFNMVTVARINNNQKRIDRIIDCVAELKQEGFRNFKWYIVGDGPDLNWLMEKANEKEVTDIIIFVGNKENPYVYMKNADVFLLSSQYEAQGMVLTESLIVGTPVIVTNYKEAEEFVKHNINGIIIDNSKQGIYQAVKEILVDKRKLSEFRGNISREIINNSQAISQLERLLKEDRNI